MRRNFWFRLAQRQNPRFDERQVQCAPYVHERLDECGDIFFVVAWRGRDAQPLRALPRSDS